MRMFCFRLLTVLSQAFSYINISVTLFAVIYLILLPKVNSDVTRMLSDFYINPEHLALLCISIYIVERALKYIASRLNPVKTELDPPQDCAQPASQNSGKIMSYFSREHICPYCTKAFKSGEVLLKNITISRNHCETVYYCPHCQQQLQAKMDDKKIQWLLMLIFLIFISGLSVLRLSILTIPFAIAFLLFVLDYIQAIQTYHRKN